MAHLAKRHSTAVGFRNRYPARPAFDALNVDPALGTHLAQEPLDGTFGLSGQYLPKLSQTGAGIPLLGEVLLQQRLLRFVVQTLPARPDALCPHRGIKTLGQQVARPAATAN